MTARGSDHARLPLKKEIIALLEEMHLPYHDYGTYTGDSCDYAVFAQRAAKAVVSGECERGRATRGAFVCGWVSGGRQG